jgi:DNA-binding NarL/FixJ family response regulator
MLKPSQSKGRIVGRDNGADGPLSRRPDVSLLDDRQWLYVQRCYQLSPRELQVAKHICLGFDNEEVAKCLQIRSGTVKTHLRNIYRRIHVTNKIGMLLTFVEQVAACYGKLQLCGGVVDSVRNNDIKPSQMDIGQKQTEVQS